MKPNKEEISNRKVIVLLIIAIAITLVGTLSVFRYEIAITGFSIANNTTSQGLAQLTIDETLHLNLTDATINLGNLKVRDTTDSDTTGSYFNVTNEGNVLMDVKVYNGSDGVLFIGGSADVDPPIHLVNISCDQAGTGATCNTTWGPLLPNSSVTTTLITDLNFTDGSDTAGIQVQVAVPYDEPPGAKSLDIVFLAVAS